MKKNDPRKGKGKDKDGGTYNMKESNAELEKGEKEYKKGKKADAFKHFQAAIAKCQENPEAHCRMAEMLIESKETVKAHEELNCAIHYKPKKGKYYYLKGKIFNNSGQTEEALNYFKRAITEDESGKEPIFYYWAAEMQYKLGEYDSAIANYREIEKLLTLTENSKIKITDFCKESQILLEVDKYKIFLGRGKCYREKGDLDNAIKDFEHAESANKEEPDVQSNFGLALSKAEKYDKAKGHFLKAYEKAGDEAANCDNLGVAYYQTQEPDDALKCFEKAIERDPNRALSHYHKGLIYLDRDDFPTAKACLEEAIRLEPKNELYFLTMGQFYQKQNDPQLYDLAITQFQKAISLNPSHVPSHFHLGQIFHLQHNLTQALASFNRVQKEMPNNAEVYLERGRVLMDKGDPLHALADFEKTAKINPEKAAAYMYRGLAKLKLTNFDDAIQDFDLAKQKSGEIIDPKIYDGLGCCYCELNKYLEAKANFDLAIELDPQNPDFWTNRAQAYYKFNKFELAHKDFTKALSLSPDDPVVYYSLGLSLFSMKKYKNAISMLKTSLNTVQETPSEMRANAFYTIGIAYCRRGIFVKSIYPFSQCIDLLQSKTIYVHERAKAYQMIGEDEKAIADFNEVIKRNPKNAHAYFRRAFSQKRLQKFEAAAKDFEKAKDLDPLNPALVVNYKMLDKVDVIVLCEPGEEKEYK